MARKKKQTRKYKPRNEFRRNKSPIAKGHVNYVFGETDTKFKSMGLTTHPSPNIPSVKLNKNPQRDSEEKSINGESYLHLKVLTTRKDMLSQPLKNWKFDKSDMAVVRHTTKKYKKSANRKPKGWYIKKKNKKNK